MSTSWLYNFSRGLTVPITKCSSLNKDPFFSGLNCALSIPKGTTSTFLAVILFMYELMVCEVAHNRSAFLKLYFRIDFATKFLLGNFITSVPQLEITNG